MSALPWIGGLLGSPAMSRKYMPGRQKTMPSSPSISVRPTIDGPAKPRECASKRQQTMSPLPSTGVRLTVRGPVTVVHIPITYLQHGLAAVQRYHGGYQCQRFPQCKSRPGWLTHKKSFRKTKEILYIDICIRCNQPESSKTVQLVAAACRKSFSDYHGLILQGKKRRQ